MAPRDKDGGGNLQCPREKQLEIYKTLPSPLSDLTSMMKVHEGKAAAVVARRAVALIVNHAVN